MGSHGKKFPLRLHQLVLFFQGVFKLGLQGLPLLHFMVQLVIGALQLEGSILHPLIENAFVFLGKLQGFFLGMQLFFRILFGDINQPYGPMKRTGICSTIRKLKPQPSVISRSTTCPCQAGYI